MGMVHAYPSNFGDDSESFASDLKDVICAGPGGTPDWEAIDALQRSYKDGTFYQKKTGKAEQVLIWHPQNWHGPEVSLVEAVRKAQERIAVPQLAHGADI